MEMANLNEREARQAFSQGPIALLPVGAVEVHGDHLPLCTDVYLAQGVTQKVAARIPNALVMPPLYYGQVWSLRDFPGSIDVSNEALIGTVAGIGRSLHRHGAKALAMINGHVGNAVALKLASRVLYEELGMKVYLFTYPGSSKAIAEVCESQRPHPVYFHACEIETSYMLYLAPEHARMEEARRNDPRFTPDFDDTPSPWSLVIDTAVFGDPTLATAQKGKAIIDAVVDHIVQALEYGVPGAGKG